MSGEATAADAGDTEPVDENGCTRAERERWRRSYPLLFSMLETAVNDTASLQERVRRVRLVRYELQQLLHTSELLQAIAKGTQHG